MGWRDELERLLGMLEATGVRPLVDAVWPLAEAHQAYAGLAEGEAFGKLVLTVGE